VKTSRILIVDDEPLIRQSLAGVLEDERYETNSVESGEACQEELTRASYDLVLLDVWLPGMDGLETLARIQDRFRSPTGRRSSLFRATAQSRRP